MNNHQPDRTASSFLLLAFALLLFVLHISVNHRYGLHRDEYYFIECGQHLDWGYVDHPPMIALITRVSGALFGHSTTGLRVFSALALAMVALLTGSITRRLGGGTYAQLLAAVSMGLSVLGLRAGAFINIPTFELLLWTTTAYTLVVLLQKDNPKLWLLVGLVAGLALMTKLSAAFMGLGILIGLAVTPARRYFKSPWLWIGGGIAMLVYLPNLIWQINHDWATLEFMRNLREDEGTSPLEFILGTMFFANIFAAPIWLAGIYFYFRDPAGKRYRLVGITALTVYFAFLILGGKVYYPASAFPMLFAAGPVVLERLFRRTSKAAYFGVIVASSLLFLPVAMPLLSVEHTDQYARTVFGFITDDAGEITTDLRGEFGWEEQVATAAIVYDGLTPEEQSQCAILTGNYGQAGAVNFYREEFGLPRAISGHNNHYFWGPGNATGEIVIAYGFSREGLETLFGEVTQAAIIQSPHAQSYETNLPVYLCRKPKAPLAELWPRMKHYN